VVVDELDRAILRCLQQNGRLSNVELAARVRLSPSPCLRRVRHLEQDGVITGYHAQIDPAAVGRGFQVVVHADMIGRANGHSARTGPQGPQSLHVGPHQGRRPHMRLGTRCASVASGPRARGTYTV